MPAWASLITSVVNECAPLLLAVSVYCRVSPALALTAVAARGGERGAAIGTPLADPAGGGGPALRLAPELLEVLRLRHIAQLDRNGMSLSA